MNRRFLSLFGTLLAFGASVLVFSACSDRSSGKAQPGQPKEVPQAVAAAAGNEASDAAFAMQIRDYDRAAKGFEKALDLRPDIAEWWESLGYVYKLQGKNSDARGAYKKAIKLWDKTYSETKDPQFGLREAVLLFLVDKADEGRALVDRLGKNHPQDQGLQDFIKEKRFEIMIQDPELLKKKV